MSNLDEFHNKKTAHLWPIALLRVYTGVFFLIYGWGKIRNPEFENGLAGFVTGNLDKAFGFFRPFLESVVLPNKGLFAVMVGWGEFLIGITLIVGLATRWASVAGALMVAAFWFTKGQGFFSAMNHDSIWFMIFIVLATVHAGRAYSLDQRLADRFRFLA